MKSIHYFAIFTYTLQLFTSPAYADCQSSKKDAAQQVEQISTQMRGANVCNSNKLTVQALEINIEFLNECPEADPDGDTRENIEASLEQAKKATSVTCSS